MAALITAGVFTAVVTAYGALSGTDQGTLQKDLDAYKNAPDEATKTKILNEQFIKLFNKTIEVKKENDELKAKQKEPQLKIADLTTKLQECQDKLKVFEEEKEKIEAEKAELDKQKALEEQRKQIEAELRPKIIAELQQGQLSTETPSGIDTLIEAANAIENQTPSTTVPAPTEVKPDTRSSWRKIKNIPENATVEQLYEKAHTNGNMKQMAFNKLKTQGEMPQWVFDLKESDRVTPVFRPDYPSTSFIGVSRLSLKQVYDKIKNASDIALKVGLSNAARLQFQDYNWFAGLYKQALEEAEQEIQAIEIEKIPTTTLEYKQPKPSSGIFSFATSKTQRNIPGDVKPKTGPKTYRNTDKVIGKSKGFGSLFNNPTNPNQVDTSVDTFQSAVNPMFNKPTTTTPVESTTTEPVTIEELNKIQDPQERNQVADNILNNPETASEEELDWAKENIIPPRISQQEKLSRFFFNGTKEDFLEEANTFIRNVNENTKPYLSEVSYKYIIDEINRYKIDIETHNYTKEEMTSLRNILLKKILDIYKKELPKAESGKETPTNILKQRMKNRERVPSIDVNSLSRTSSNGSISQPLSSVNTNTSGSTTNPDYIPEQPIQASEIEIQQAKQKADEKIEELKRLIVIPQYQNIVESYISNLENYKNIIKTQSNIDELNNVIDNTITPGIENLINLSKIQPEEQPIVDAAVQKIQPPNIPTEEKQQQEKQNQQENQIEDQINLSGINKVDTANITTSKSVVPPNIQQPINATRRTTPITGRNSKKLNPNEQLNQFLPKEDLSSFGTTPTNIEEVLPGLKTTLRKVKEKRKTRKQGASRKSTFKARRVNKQNERRRTPRGRKNSANRSYKNSR